MRHIMNALDLSRDELDDLISLAEQIMENPRESAPRVRIVENMPRRMLVGDTDTGARLREQISQLQDLLAAYRDGTIKEQGE